MRMLSPVVVAGTLALGIACEGEFDPGVVQPFGIQIGSEGLLRDCDTETVGAGDSIDGFDFTPSELAGKIVIPWDATLAGPQGPLPGALSMRAESFAMLTGEEDCIGVWMELTGEAAFAPGLEAPLVGNLLVNQNGAAEYAVWSESWTGDLQPSFDPTAMRVARMRLAGVASETALSGTAAFIGCDDTDCVSEPIGDVTATPALP